jgi:hypothetical protein
MDGIFWKKFLLPETLHLKFGKETFEVWNCVLFEQSPKIRKNPYQHLVRKNAILSSSTHHFTHHHTISLPFPVNSIYLIIIYGKGDEW